MNFSLLHGDATDMLATIETSTVDAVVTDPPYGLSKAPDIVEVMTRWAAGEDYQHRGTGFAGETWDSFVPGPSLWKEVYRTLKPGGYATVFAATRTVDLTMISLRMAGFEIRDMLAWHHSQGMPKGHDLGKSTVKYGDAPGRWDGWSTALKPSFEPVVLVRKPPDGPVGENVAVHGVGGLHIDATRIATSDTFGGGRKGTSGFATGYTGGDGWVPGSEKGRWPANTTFQHDVQCVPTGQMTLQGDRRSGTDKAGQGRRQGGFAQTGQPSGDSEPNAQVYGDQTVDVYACVPSCPVRTLHHQTENAYRFFYCPKPNPTERDAGLPDRNPHGTVKPVELMRWLVRLVTPEGGLVLDPFVGSGTTGIAAALEGAEFVGIEQNETYVDVARQRIVFWTQRHQAETAQQELF